MPKTLMELLFGKTDPPAPEPAAAEAKPPSPEAVVLAAIAAHLDTTAAELAKAVYVNPATGEARFIPPTQPDTPDTATAATAAAPAPTQATPAATAPAAPTTSPSAPAAPAAGESVWQRLAVGAPAAPTPNGTDIAKMPEDAFLREMAATMGQHGDGAIPKAASAALDKGGGGSR